MSGLRPRQSDMAGTGTVASTSCDVERLYIDVEAADKATAASAVSSRNVKLSWR
jgi:hypothetical protein